MEHLTVTKTDLDSVELPVILSNIELLDFDDSVDWPTFNGRSRRSLTWK